MKSGVGFLAFRLCRWASVLLIILLSLLVVSCDLWNKDMLGYLKYWSETVQLGKVEVSDATIQKNDAGADTIPVAATPTIAVYVVNPQGYGLLAEIGDSSSVDKSVRVSDSAVQSKAQVVAHEPTMLKVQLGSADGSLEHTEFRVDFEAIRKDTMQSSGQVMGVTLRYNTPPVAPTPVVWSYDSSQHEVVKDGETWEAGRDGILYWAYDDSITKETDPNCAKWFSINGTRHPVAECKVPDVQVDGLSVFQFKTNYGSISVAAVDSEGVSSPAVASGQAVPPATYVIKYDGNGADGGTAPTSQSKTQYTPVTLAANVGNLTKIGYKFSGWNTRADGTGTTYSAGATYSADAGVTLYAKWEAVDAVVLTPESGAVNHGATVTLTPPKSDATIYYQIGGADETAGAPGQPVTVTLYNASHSPSRATGVAAGIPEGGSVTLTAHAVYADGTKSEVTTGDYRLNQYTVGYEGNGNGDAVDNVPALQTFYSGGSVAIGGGANRPVRIGYRFTGWNTDPDGAGTTYSAGAAYSADEGVTLYAQWEAVDAVTFSRDGAVNSGDTVQLTPPKSDATIHYQINGTGETAGAKGQPVTVTLHNASNPPQNQNTTGAYAGIPEGGKVTITAYAKYADGTQSEVTTGDYSLNQYTVSYNGNKHTGGKELSQQIFYSGGSVTVQGKDNLTKIGYTFTGWQGDDGQPYSQGNVYGGNENLTLTAQWDPNTYYVSFDSNGGSGSMDDQTFTYDGKQALSPNDFTPPTGYEFVGWKDDDSNVYTDNQSVSNLTDIDGKTVTLTAQWGCQLQDSAQQPSGYTSPHAPSNGSWKYVEFGYWPQTVKEDNVTVYTKLSKEVGMFTYYLGSDGDWYVEVTAKPYKDTYTYSDGKSVEKDKEVYFKVEPIKWRVLTENYIDADGNGTGYALLLAEKILTGGIKWADSKNDYMESNIRKWLNGNSGTGENSDYSGTPGFLQTAFTADAQSLIAAATVDNSEKSTFGTGEQSQSNPYAFGKTKDKIFLLSQKEATDNGYGFAAYDHYGTSSTRIRVTTDYAKATGAEQDSTPDYGGWWWLRSPYYYIEYNARFINNNGYAIYNQHAYNTNGGVVPALCIPAKQLLP